MNKTVNINLAGTFFHIDDDAFAKLTRYLDAIRRSFSDPQGQDEIIRDIEARIAELFSEKIEDDSQVITLKELDEVITVMGQPEDYIIDEEIFEDTPDSKKRRTRSSSSYKQLFRDIDNKFIAGVSSGLSHYLNIDALWIRLIWIVLVLIGWGTPILIYILLWVLVPAAESTSDKLKMEREPINISNIEKKFKEGYENVADKVKDVDIDKYKQKAKSGVTGLFTTLGSIFLVIFKIFVKFIGILLIIISLSTLIGLIVGLFTTLGSIFLVIFKIFVKFIGILLIIISLSTLIGLIVGLFTAGTIGFWGNGVVMDHISVVDITNAPLWLISLLTLFVVGIPFFVLFIVGLKMLITNLKSIGNPAKISLLAIWIFSIIGLGILAIRQATDHAYDGDYTSEIELPVRSGDTLRLVMNVNRQYEYSVRRGIGFEIKYNANDEKVIYSNNIRLIIRSTEDSVAKLYIEKKAKGKTFLDAKDNAEAIEYNYSIENNTLLLDGYFINSFENKYHDQKMEIIVYLPVGTILFADNNTYSYHRNYYRYGDILNNGYEEHYLLIQEDKTRCLDCPINKENENWENEDWEDEVNKLIDNIDENTSIIIIDKNKLDTIITEIIKDTIQIKIGN